jgi:hypothetical protein
MRSPFAIYVVVVFVVVPLAAVLATVGRYGLHLQAAHGASIPKPPGSVTVNGLTANRGSIVSGSSVSLYGVVPGGHIGKRVTILARASGTTAFEVYGITTTTAPTNLPAGYWSQIATPVLATQFVARSGGRSLGPVLVKVAPKVGLFRRGNRLLLTVSHIVAIKPTRVSLQRYVASRWKTIARTVARPIRERAVEADATLSAGSLPAVSRLRAYVSEADAGPGYLAGQSPILTYRR